MWWKTLFVLIAGFLLWRYVGWEDMQTISQTEVPGKVVKVVLVAAVTLLVLFGGIVLAVKPWKGTNSGPPRTQAPPVTPSPGATPGGTPPPAPQAGTAAPAAPSGPSLGKRFSSGLWKLLKGLWWLVSRLFVVAVVAFLVLAYLGERQSGQAEKIAALERKVLEAAETKEKEVWEFWQISQSGEKQWYDVEVQKNEDGQMNLTIQRKGAKKKNVAGMRLVYQNGNLVGTWVNYLDGDRGEAKLIKQAENLWAGNYVLQNTTIRLCGLKKEVRE